MLRLDFINIGYGDSILVREFKGSKQIFSMLVDCGDVKVPIPEGSRRLLASEFLKKEKISELDLLVQTHLHLDHVGGLESILKKVKVKEFWCNYLSPTEWGKEIEAKESLSSGAKALYVACNIYSRSLKILRESSSKIKLIYNGKSRAPLGSGKLEYEVFYETSDIIPKQNELLNYTMKNGAYDAPLKNVDSFINDTSIRLKLYYDDISIVLPGDIYADCWSKYQLERCNILKMPHHAHNDSFSEALAEMLRPDYTVISVSNDRPDDCPAKGIIQLLSNYSGDVSFTDAVKTGENELYHNSVRFEIKNNKIQKQYYKF